MRPLISVFPKCYFDDLVAGRRDYVQWIRDAAHLGGEGVEHYDEFFRSLDSRDVDPVLEAMAQTGQTKLDVVLLAGFHASRPGRARAADRASDAPLSICRSDSARDIAARSRAAAAGGVARQGIEWSVACITRSLEYAETRGVMLCLENHYKVGEWLYPEFAQPEDVFLEILERIDHPSFGVQYDPSNAVVGGFDPIRFLEKIKHRVVTMHASDRYLVPGTTLDEIRAADGTVGYPDKLRHGETGQGLNDYDAIFRILADVGFSGWISVEDGMNGLDELARSVSFLKTKRAEYFGG